MTSLRNLLVTMTAAMLLLTVAAVSREGFNLLPHYLQPLKELTWQGQFNADFACYLILSGVWMAWRGGFSRTSIALGVLAPPFGILFFAPYLVYLIGRSQGDHVVLLLGVHASKHRIAE